MYPSPRVKNCERLDRFDAGNGSPIVFLHGFSLDRTMWTAQCEALRGEHRVLAFDLPGHGSSSDFAGEVSPASEVLRSLEAANVARAVLVGSSLGAAVAIDLALERPSIVEDLVLLDPILLGASAPNPEQSILADLALRGDLDGARARWLQRPAFHETLRHEVAGPLLRSMVARYQGAHWSGRLRDAWLHLPHAEKLSMLDLRVTVFVGEQGGQRGVDMAREIGSLCPRVAVEILPGIGHLSPLESPDAITARIRRIARVT